MQKNKISKYIIFVAAFTLFSVFIHVVQNSYDKLMAPLNQVRTSAALKPIDTKLEADSIEFIQKRTQYPEDDSLYFVSVPSTSSSTVAPTAPPSSPSASTNTETPTQ